MKSSASLASLLAATLFACASAETSDVASGVDATAETDSSASSSDVRSESAPDVADAADAGADTRPRDGTIDDASGDALFPLDDTALPPCALPTGTTASATSSYPGNGPELAADGNTDTYWNSGGYTGSLTLTFPAPVHLDGVRVWALASPSCSEPYAFTGSLAGAPTPLATSTYDVVGGSWMPITSFTPGTYDTLTLDVGTSASWIAVGEVLPLDSTTCAAP